VHQAVTYLHLTDSVSGTTRREMTHGGVAWLKTVAGAWESGS
jgi:hypothetical protein